MDGGRRTVTLRDGAGASPLARGSHGVRLGRTRSMRPSPSTGAPPFAVPGMVLLAAVAIFEGYQWLQIIPGGSLHLSGLLFALAAVPATWWLTRHGDGRRVGLLRRVAVAGATAVPLFGVLVLLGWGAGASKALGAASLLVAVAVLAIAAASERGDRSASTR